MGWKRIVLVGVAIAIIGAGGYMFTSFWKPAPKRVFDQGESIQLPAPRQQSETSVEEAILKRRSLREYEEGALTLAEVGQILWSAQGITHPDGYRTAPSAGALYPLEVYLVAGEVEGLEAGIYRYLPEGHALLRIAKGDRRANLAAAALRQTAIQDAPAAILISAVYERTTFKYGERGIRYVHMEVGHAAQNVYLQVEALRLGTVFIGAFQDEMVKDVTGLAVEEEPVGIMPVGRK